ncbi:hypothetical protein ACFXJ5_06290 [Streptomyces sp. NPDC059373]
MVTQERSTDADDLEIGTLAVDTARGEVGEVRGHVGPYVQMRPQDGGLEWDARPENIRPLSAAETLSAKVAQANRRSGGGY